MHLSHWPEARPEWRAPELEEDFEQLLSILMPVVKKRLEEARAAKEIGHPYDAKVTLRLHSKKLWNLAKKYEALLPSLLIVSACVLDRDAPRDGLALEPEEVLVEVSGERKCARCWRRPGDVEEADELCGRCRSALAA